MRRRTAIGVLVLATGVMCGRAAVAADPALTPKAGINVIPWRQAEPKPEHALLKGLAGHWTTAVHVAEGPFAKKARDTTGTADGKLLMGGLFLVLTQTETRMKQAFEAMTTYGFNVALGKYTADVIDSAGTESLHYTGTYDADKKQLTMSTHYTEGKTRKFTIRRTVIASIDDKTWKYEEYVSHAVGEKEMPVVAITFKRP